MAKVAQFLLILFALCTSALATEWRKVEAKKPTSKPVMAPEINGLPDGETARYEGSQGLVRAAYTMPTTRYEHGILGDKIEAGGLQVTTENGDKLTFTLPKNQVFEDRTPRLFDLGATGKVNIITILSDVNKGASIAVFGIEGKALKLLAQTPYIGQPNRWRNIAGIADYDGDGSIQIAEVVTPHIGGILKFWTWKGGALVLSGEMPGFSNHAIGSRKQALSFSEDFDDDGVVDIALPSTDRKHLRLIKFLGKANGKKTIVEINSIPFHAAIDKNMAITSTDKGISFVVGLEDNTHWELYR